MNLLYLIVQNYLEIRLSLEFSFAKKNLDFAKNRTLKQNISVKNKI